MTTPPWVGAGSNFCLFPVVTPLLSGLFFWMHLTPVHSGLRSLTEDHSETHLDPAAPEGRRLSVFRLLSPQTSCTMPSSWSHHCFWAWLANL